jgi:hypothetical protein
MKAKSERLIANGFKNYRLPFCFLIFDILFAGKR